MDKKEKIESLDSAMALKHREQDAEGDGIYIFKDSAPPELVGLFLEHYSVRDLDYEIFHDACELVSDIYSGTPSMSSHEASARVSDDNQEKASVYTSTRLGYLNNQNEGDISETMLDMGIKSIADACAYWYEEQVKEAAQLINRWINE